MYRMLVFGMLLVASAAAGQGRQSPAVGTPFDVQGAVERISRRPIHQGSRVVIDGRSYRVSLEEPGIVLRARGVGQEERTRVIPVQGKPARSGDRTICRTAYGTVVVRTAAETRSPDRAQQARWPSALRGRAARHGPGDAVPLGAEFLIDHSLVVGPAEDEQVMPMVASNGTDYLVVWVDWGMDGAVCYARVSGAGQLLDSIAIVADADAEMEETPPSVTFDGVNYLITWSAWGEDTDMDVLGARVSPLGVLIDTDPLVFRQTTGDEGGSVVCRGQNTSLVVWFDYNGAELYGSRITQAGTVLDPGGILITNQASDWLGHTVAFDGTNWLVAWEDGGDIYGRRVTQAGAVLDPTPITISSAANSQYFPQATYGAGSFFVVWNDNRNPSPQYEDVYGARVSSAGVVLDPAGIVVSSANYEQYFPYVVFDGTNYLTSWQDWRDDGEYRCARVTPAGVLLDPGGIVVYAGEMEGEWPCGAAHGTGNSLLSMFIYADEGDGDGDVFGSRITSGGTILDPDPILISCGTVSDGVPQIASDGTGYFVVWSAVRAGSGEDIFGARVSAQGQVLDPNGVCICGASGWQNMPKVVYNGESYLVVWQDYRNGDPDIYAARVSISGSVLDPTGIPVATGASYAYVPTVATDGSNSLVVWPSDWSGEIRGARVSRSGAVLDPTGISIMTRAQYIDDYRITVTFGSTCYLVAAEYYTGSLVEVCVARVSTAGVALDPAGLQVAPTGDYQELGDVAFDGTNFLVVWDQYEATRNLRAARVTQAGTVLDPTGIAVAPAPGDEFRARTAFGGGNYLVVWMDGLNGIPCDLYCTRLTPAGVVLDPAGIRVAADAAEPWWWWGGDIYGVIFDGSSWLIVWATMQDFSRESDLHGASVSAAGVRTDSVMLAGGPGRQYSPALAHGQGTQVLTSYLGWTERIGGRTANTHRVWGVMRGTTGIPTGWSTRASVPSAQSSKPVKDGAWLADDGAHILAAKGNKTTDFYQYNPGKDSWRALTPWPNGTEGKPPSKGSAACSDGAGRVYATKGNNTAGFWMYQAGTWTPKCPVPLGPSNKKVKGGTSLVHASNGLVYLLKGYKNEFWRYHANGDSWHQLPDAPIGSNLKWDKGSWLAYDGAHTIYAHKAKYHEFYPFDLNAGTWGAALTPMPVPGSAGNKKSKDGSCGVFGPGDWNIYALKGGGTQEFWCYTVATNSWVEKESIPRGLSGKKVKAGADIINFGGLLYALKGNKTLEFWRYLPAMADCGRLRETGDGVAAERAATGGWRLAVSPNPVTTGFATLSFTGTLGHSGTGPLRISIYNASGRCVQTAICNLKSEMALDLRGLRPGVYLVKLASSDFTSTQKLVVQR